MKSSSIKIRTFNVSGNHEIMLPNKKTILIDPFFPVGKTGECSRESVSGADYILVTHTHFDHETDLGYFVKKFNSKVFVGAFSAMAAMKFHKIPYDYIFPVFPGQKFTLEDFTLEAWQAKHNPSGGRIFSPEDDIAKKELGIEGHLDCDDMGSMESLDYLITTKNNFRILMASGQTIWSDLFEICKEKRPNLLLRQAGLRRSNGDLFTGEQVSPAELAELFVKYGAQIIMPFHMDVLCNRWGENKVEEYFREVGKEISELDPGAQFLYPTACKWYNIGLDISEE